MRRLLFLGALLLTGCSPNTPPPVATLAPPIATLAPGQPPTEIRCIVEQENPDLYSPASVMLVVSSTPGNQAIKSAQAVCDDAMANRTGWVARPVTTSMDGFQSICTSSAVVIRMNLWAKADAASQGHAYDLCSKMPGVTFGVRFRDRGAP
jgi:hypothetical protein